MYPYYTFPEIDASSIYVRFEAFDQAHSVDPHIHRFYEFAFIQRGSCIHTYHGAAFPLIAGDLLLISPDEPHAYDINPDTQIINCYFFPEKIYQLSSYIVDGAYVPPNPPRTLEDFRQDWDHMLTVLSLRDVISPMEPMTASEMMERQGVLHLSANAALQVEMILNNLQEECLEPQFNSEEMKMAYLQLLLGIFSRTAARQISRDYPSEFQKKQQITRAISMIEENYHEALTVQDLADATGFSPTAFRKIFKEVTGLSPLDYINRVRIVNALKLIQYRDMPIAEAAAEVGIYDANYFTRLFKKLLGHPPKYFRKITG